MPKVNEHCNGCGQCVDACPAGAIQIEDGKAVIDADNCVECGVCVDECPQAAVERE
jgi:ferredoxin